MNQPASRPRSDIARLNIARLTAVSAKRRLMALTPISSAPEDALGAVALDLVHRAAQLIRGIEDRSADIGGRARSLVQRALQLAEARVRTAEAERQSAVDAAAAKIQELEIELAQTQARCTTAEIKISAAEMRAKVAEARASEAMSAITQIEDSLRNEIFEPRRDAIGDLIAAA
jgi:hypothetical protein